jgi:hypothetical protein
VSNHFVLLIWKFYSFSVKIACACGWWSISLVRPYCGRSITIVCIQRQTQEEEEEMHASRAAYQGQGKSSRDQGNEVATSGIAVCFDCTLSAQIKQQASTHGYSSVRTIALEVESQ